MQFFKTVIQVPHSTGFIYISLNWVSGEGNGTPLQYSYLENPMDGGAWWVTVQGVAKSQTQLSDFTSYFFLKLR